ncbi:glycosyltransferase family 2 protein [Segetibacter aerophilus]|uniref:Glycosyltransferase 2-like domain-containing protein n=1 Tax=Segetibacter aerophilus TaxID=670293 RepID=A0A512BEQ4_9BACT|nr:glycosyltransferase family 2 protein [Segetibacter aerophilus]GEO10456.1 hypothetical protein SAE01_29520 [Segetibacter aerophilus]
MPLYDIAVVINSFNRIALLRESLLALSLWLPTSELNDRCVIIIYDAGSTDGSIEWIESVKISMGLVLKIVIPEPGDDTSFAAGLNTAVEVGLQTFPHLKYLLFYETDNQILEAKPVLEAINQLNVKEKLAACGFTVRKHNGTSAGIGQPFPTLLGFALGKHLVHRLKMEAVPFKWQQEQGGVEFSELDVVYTSPLLVKVAAWKESGGLNAILFPFSECDVDWAKRLRKLGWKMGVIRSNAVIHDNLETISAWSATRSMQYHRAKLRYFKCYNPTAVYTVWPLFLIVRHLLELLAATLVVREPFRRTQLTHQTLDLIKASVKGYER